MRWRWDQGRLEYFRYENILRMAKTLYRLNGVYLNTAEDLLRLPLESDTELPFAPSHYKVWRNYARVFQCALLATKVDNRLVATDICRRLATSPELFSADAYLGFLFTRFAPSCHKSIHAYYRRKLAEWGIDDFGSKKMAADVYRMAKQEMVL